MESKTITDNLENLAKIKVPAISLWRYVVLAVIAWTGVVVIFLAGTLHQENQAALEIARYQARSHIEQIGLYRQWNALHNGVYVQVDERTPPNPYLANLPERDLRTPSGKKLTLINPAYMIRQLYELAHNQYQTQGRIVSLNPLRPQNIPDFWETKALKKLEQGTGEYSSIEHMPDQDYLRMIRPLVIEKTCLECHASQGYKVGDIRGGISVLAPIEPLRAAGWDHLSMVWISHGFFWLLGLGGIALASTRLGRSLAQQRRTELDLQEANQTLGALIKAAPLAIMALDAQGCIRLWNQAAEGIFGWRASEVVGQTPPFLPENPEEDFQELYSRGLEGEPVCVVGGCSHRNGMIMDISFSMSPLFSPQEGLTGVMAVLEDITERRQTEEELFKVNEELKIWILEFGRRNRDITLLNEMGDLLQACQTVEEAYAGVGQYVRRMFPEDSGALYIFNKENNLLEAVANWGKITPETLSFHPDDCWALRRGQEHLIKDPASELLCGHLENAVSTGSLCVPMIAHGENLGLLLLIKNSQEASADEPRSDSRQRLASTAARQIALSIANLNLKNFLMHQAIRDPLTGLFNRRYMEETLEREIFRVMRKDAPLGIIMVDLDLFKKFNDSLGHVAGDVLLQTIGNFLRNNVRREDIACRYGGDEFVLIMPEASLEITCQRAEKLRQEVQRLQIDYRGQPLGPVTISLGVASFPTHGDRVETVLKAADEALYQAKERGRNLVVVAPEETGSI